MVTSWLSQSADEAAAEAALVQKHPIGRIGEPQEVASAIAFLASNDAGFMTGLAIPVDGGTIPRDLAKKAGRNAKFACIAMHKVLNLFPLVPPESS